MPRLPFATAVLSLLTLTARAAELPPEPEAPAASEPSVVAEPPVTTEPAPPAAPRAPTPTAPGPATASAVAAAPAVTPVPVRRLKRDRPGLALSLGIGFTYSLFGGQARYDIPVRRSLTVSPFVGAGFFGLLAGPVGVAAALGDRHRLVGNLAVAPLGRNVLILHGTRVEGTMVYGPMAAIGYEHMSDGGWIQRVTIEYAYAAWGSTLPITDPHVIFYSVGFGWRIW